MSSIAVYVQAIKSDVKHAANIQRKWMLFVVHPIVILSLFLSLSPLLPLFSLL